MLTPILYVNSYINHAMLYHTRCRASVQNEDAYTVNSTLQIPEVGEKVAPNINFNDLNENTSYMTYLQT